ncbi:copper resistance CopC family protein [Microlunatus antarcticus]|uniref:Methionine-rich copper-binding protein CopC n=1 Tax=Microlunatus antarcticus TaxID=53388 RepID=A0A7W5P8T5_9ACTN|nr:methionine-rich copper-binding protein CopC [Microlunatus antarcticus]
MTHRRRAVVERATWPFLPLALLLALLLGGTFAALPATPAHAVTPVASEPRDRQKVSQAPGAVTLAFSRDVDPSVAKVVVLGPNGENVTSGPLIVEGTNVTSQLREDLDRGTYTVHYRIDGKDGDPEGGAYQFAYGSGSFTDLPDKSWSGEDEEPAVLAGTNPNGSEQPDPPSSTNTPGIEVTSQAPSSEPPPPTDPPSTVKAPEGPATDEPSSDETSEAPSASPQPETGSSGAPWIVGGVVLLLAVAGTAFGLWHKNKEKAPGHD